MSLRSRAERPADANGDAPYGLVGRAQQLQQITALLGPGTVEGRALLLSGEPGVGKSALLGEVAEVMAATGARVLSAAGVRSEAELAYAGLHQLLFSLSDRYEHLPDPYREALRGALGFGGGPVPDRTLVTDSVLFLLRRAAAERPVLIVVDDLAWLDRASSMVLDYVARRPASDRIGFLAASRTGTGTFFERAGLPEYELPPLDHRAATELLGAHFPELAVRVRDRVLAQAQGNPLVLLELPTALSGPQRGALADLPAALPLSPRLRTLYTPQVSSLPAASRRLLLLLALDGTGDLGVLGTGSADSGTPKALAAAESDGLITVDATNRRVAFRHPLIRAAVIETSTLTERCRSHRSLAEIRAEEPERRAWHLGEATLVPDERVAALLETAGQGLARRGDAAGAVAALTRSAELSPRPEDRGRRLTEAAYLEAHATGELRAAAELLGGARKAAPDLTGSLRTATTAALVLLNSGNGDVETAHRLLVDAVETGTHGYDAGDDTLVEAMHTLFLVCWCGGRADLWDRFETVLRRLKPAPPLSLSACSRTLAEPARTGAAGLKELDSILAGLPDGEDPGRIVHATMATVTPDRLAQVRDVSGHVVREGRRGGPVRQYIRALMNLCLDDFLIGRWEAAGTLADEGLRICEEHRYRFLSWYFHYIQALLAAVHGRFEESRALADRITQWAVPRGVLGAVACAGHARVLASLGEGDYEAAHHHAVAISPAGHLASHVPHAMWACMDLVEAAVHTGRTAEAEVHVRAVRESGIVSFSPRLALLVEGSAALVPLDDQAPERFEQALAVPGVEDWPFDLARIRLAYGEHLRRMRSITEARAQLDAAAQAFERLGARPWADRAAGELRATGRSRTRATRDSVTLTAQELEIAHLAASGLTNKQIGERLHLSPRTVGSHLYQLFPKLQIASRAALRDALAALPQGR
ncbi:ATP-binding protein [Streptomyces sp. NPDC051738]|uniref:ATP-binding protein n=1 Tax=Streptomyces sp. NPDC051738 TaxID=3365672 RepID=UPI0037CD8616